jgi:hypothetical protein
LSWPRRTGPRDRYTSEIDPYQLWTPPLTGSQFASVDVPNTGTALIILVAFVLPGFVTVLMQERTFLSARDPTDLDRLMRIVLYSGLNYLLLALLAMLTKVHRSNIVRFFDTHRSNPALLVVAGAMAVILPSAAIWQLTKWWHTCAFREIFLEWRGINARHTVPTAWDHFWLQRQPALVRVTYKDGHKLYGYYGPHSFAAYAKDGGDLYLEQWWIADDEWFDKPALGTLGVWISGTDIDSAEFYTSVDASAEATAAIATKDDDGSHAGTGEEGRAPSPEGEPGGEGSASAEASPD